MYGVPLGPLGISSLAFLFKKKKREVFTWKPQTCLKFTGFKKREARECESARARERECDSEGEISFPRSRTLSFSSLAFLKGLNFRHVWSFICPIRQKKILFFSIDKTLRMILPFPLRICRAYTRTTIEIEYIITKYNNSVLVLFRMCGSGIL